MSIVISEELYDEVRGFVLNVTVNPLLPEGVREEACELLAQLPFHDRRPQES